MEPNRQLSVAAAQKAVVLDPNDAGNRWVYGLLLAREHQWAEAEAEFAVALKLDPNNADTWAMLSELMVLSGRPTDALANIEKALRLNPHPPGWYYWFLGQVAVPGSPIRPSGAQLFVARKPTAYGMRGVHWPPPWHNSDGSTRRAGRRKCSW